MDDRARTQLGSWFRDEAARRPLRAWIDSVRSSYLPVTDPGPEPTHVVECPGARLVVRWLPGAGGTDLLVLEEQPRAAGGDSAAGLGLRPRQVEVVRLVAQGRTNAQIATELHVSVATVKKHLERIYRQLGVNNRTAAVARVREELGQT